MKKKIRKFHYPKLINPEFLKSLQPMYLEESKITEEDIELAFDYFTKGKRKSKITVEELHEGMKSFFPNLKRQDYFFLTAGKTEITKKKLKKIMKNPILKNFNPNKEAFKVLDPKERGFVDSRRLRMMFEIIGFEVKKVDVNNFLESIKGDIKGISFNEFLDLNMKVNKK